MRFKIQTTVLLFVLLGIVSACNTFKDEITPDSYMGSTKAVRWEVAIKNCYTQWNGYI